MGKRFGLNTNQNLSRDPTFSDLLLAENTQMLDDVIQPSTMDTCEMLDSAVFASSASLSELPFATVAQNISQAGLALSLSTWPALAGS